jgi:hypothetical protein
MHCHKLLQNGASLPLSARGLCVTNRRNYARSFLFAPGGSFVNLIGPRRERVLILGNSLTIQATDGSLKAFWIPLAPVIGRQSDASFRLSCELANRKFT